MCDDFKLARSHSGDILFACLFSAWCSWHCTSYYQPGRAFSLCLVGPAPLRLLVQKQHDVSGGSFHSGLLLKNSFPFPGSATCYRKFPCGKAIVSLAAMQGQCSAQVTLEQLHSSGQVIPLLITATQLYEASMDYMQAFIFLWDSTQHWVTCGC